MNSINFNFNREKAVEVILYFANKKNNITKIDLLKYLFFADLYHLEHYGRIITGGHYCAMKRGPVHSEVYDNIKYSNNDYEIKNHYYIIPKRQANLDYFSVSDIEAMDYAFNQYSQYTPEELSNISHAHKAWINARKNTSSANPLMNFEDMIENDETIEFLQEYSGLMAI